MPTARKTRSVEVTGTVMHCDMRRQRPQFGYRSYDKGREHYNITLYIRLEGKDGRHYCFYSTPAEFSINSSGPFSISIVSPNNWIARSKERWDVKGFAGARGMGQLYESRIKLGDELKIEGRIKNEKAKHGILLSHVRRLDFDYNALVKFWQDRCNAARQKVPTHLPPQATPPTFPGVRWSHLGGYPNESEPDRGIPSGQPFDHRWLGWESQIESVELLLAHVEGRPIEDCQEPN